MLTRKSTMLTESSSDINLLFLFWTRFIRSDRLDYIDRSVLFCFSDMDYTELFHQSNGLVAFSNGAHWLANAVNDRLVVRRADTFQITRAWRVDVGPSATNVAFATNSNRHTNPVAAQSSASAPPAIASSSADPSLISHIGWSADSEFLLAASARHGIVNVFKMRDEDWSARIEAGVEGLLKAEWAPDGRHILCFSEWGVCPPKINHAQISP